MTHEVDGPLGLAELQPEEMGGWDANDGAREQIGFMG